MGGYQNYDPVFGPLNTECRILLRTQKGTMILTIIYYSYLLGLEASHTTSGGRSTTRGPKAA